MHLRPGPYIYVYVYRQLTLLVGILFSVRPAVVSVLAESTMETDKGEGEEQR